MFLSKLPLLGLFKVSKNLISHHIALVTIFAVIYYVCDKYFQHTAFEHINKGPHEMTLLDCIYFSLVTQTTVGYGDYVPIHPVVRMVTIVQMLTIYGSIYL